MRPIVRKKPMIENYVPPKKTHWSKGVIVGLISSAIIFWMVAYADEAKGEARGWVEGGRLVINGVTTRYGTKTTTRNYKDTDGRWVTETITVPLTEPTCPHGMKVLRYGVAGC